MKTGRKLGTISMVFSAGLLLSTGSCATTQRGPASDAVQGWNERQRSSWYQATQGSRLMPLAWARALERADSQERFFTDANLTRYRFLPLPGSEAGLPIGFAIDRNNARRLSYTNLTWYRRQPAREPWIGLNCSACHTGRFTYQGREETVDGAPSLLDFQGFIEGVDGAMAATSSDPAKWERFAARVLAGRDNAANRDLLRREFGRLLAFQQDTARLNATTMRYGYGRLDAVGHIFNKVAQLAVYETSPRVRATPNAADAPVNYPFLWDIYRHNRLQWNGIVGSRRIPPGGTRYLDVGALGRNTGEVIGVFGDVVLRPNSSPRGFRSSVNFRNLNSLETVLTRLRAPRWPASFPALDQARIDAGRALFDSRGCRGCHEPQPPGTSVYEVRMEALTRPRGVPNPNNTDPWMACNAITFTSATGKLEGTRSRYISGDPMLDEARLGTMLSASVLGSIVGGWKEVLGTGVQIFLDIERLPRVEGAEDVVSEAEQRAGRLETCFGANDLARGPNDPPPFAYKARPLDGIWATAPYLHNGSVPTLYDLLLPAARRPRSFNIGTREFDPVRVGYRTEASAPGNGFVVNARGPGNSNEGHDYNVGRLTEEERWALVEYLKSL